MTLDRTLVSSLKKLDRHDLRRVSILVRGLLLAHGDDSEERAETLPSATGTVTYRLEKVRCGKPGCRSCPHGPYWYAYYREKGRLRSRYIGPQRSEEGLEGGDQGN